MRIIGLICPLYLSRHQVSDLLIYADVQIITRLIGEEKTDWNGIPSRCKTDVDLQLSLQDPQLPQTAAVAHHHGADRLLYLRHQGKDKDTREEM